MNLEYQKMVYLWFYLNLKLARLKVKNKILDVILHLAQSYYWMMHFRYIETGARPSKTNLKA